MNKAHELLIGFIVGAFSQHSGTDLTSIIEDNQSMKQGADAFKMFTSFGRNSNPVVSANLAVPEKRQYKRKHKGTRVKGSRMYKGKIVSPTEAKRLVNRGLLSPK